MSFLIIANMFWKIYDVKFNTLWVNQTINVILFDQVNEWFSQLNEKYLFKWLWFQNYIIISSIITQEH